MRRAVQWTLSLLVSAVALGLAFWGVSLNALLAALRSANYDSLPWALTLVFLGQVARAKSWQTILGHDLPWSRVFSALNAGYLLNNLLPFRLGELGRAYLISRSHKMSTSQALSSVLVERVIDLCLIVGMLALFLPLAAGLLRSSVAVVAVFLTPVLALTALIVLSRQPAWLLWLVRWGVGLLARLWGGAQRLEAMFYSFLAGLSALRDGGRLIRAALWSGAAWVAAGFSAALMVRAFRPEAGLSESVSMGFFVLVIVGLGVAVPAAPGSIGVWQAAAVAALSVFGVEKSLALSFGLVNHLANYSLTSLLGAVALTREGETLDHLARSARMLLSASPTIDDRRRATDA